MWILSAYLNHFSFWFPRKIIIIAVLYGSTCSKKQKVAGNSSDQSIEQLNDVTAVSGVNLRVRILVASGLI